MDLIDRETAYKVLTEYYHHRMEIQHKGLREALAKVPTALVRCKDCKYWQEQDYGVVEVSICTKGGDILEMDSNDFCSRGERKVEE